MKKEIKKDNFIQILSELNNDEINRLIEEKGKKPKPIKPILLIK